MLALLVPQKVECKTLECSNASGCSGLYRTRGQQVWVQLSRGPLQAILSKLLAYCVLRPTQPPTLSGMEKEQ